MEQFGKIEYRRPIENKEYLGHKKVGSHQFRLVPEVNPEDCFSHANFKYVSSPIPITIYMN